jgi:hypothetical protein
MGKLCRLQEDIAAGCRPNRCEDAAKTYTCQFYFSFPGEK